MRPTDPDYGKQWQWEKIGIEMAWEDSLGKAVEIAVIDHGFDAGHADLNPGISPRSGFFNRGTFTKTVKGFRNLPHGTMCAGMAGARCNNDRGGCGAAPETELLLISTQYDTMTSQETLARAIRYAVNPQSEGGRTNPSRGVDVITCSLGLKGGKLRLSTKLKDAIDFAVREGRGGLGTPVFWAVANEKTPIGDDEVASYHNVIAVGSARADDRRAECAFGDELDLIAPGDKIYSTTIKNKYKFDSGTSFATPCAAGVAAIVIAVCPTLTWVEVRDLLCTTCAKVGDMAYVAGRNTHYGYGRLDAAEAISSAKKRRGTV